MGRRRFLLLGVVGLVTALALSASLVVRHPPRFTDLTQATGVFLGTGWSITGTALMIRIGPTVTETIHAGWCAHTVGSLAAGDTITVWVDRTLFGHARGWRIQRGATPICRFTDAMTSLTVGNRRLRTIAFLAGAVGLVGFAGLLIEARRLHTG
jgi:hypothetical protein